MEYIIQRDSSKEDISRHHWKSPQLGINGKGLLSYNDAINVIIGLASDSPLLLLYPSIVPSILFRIPKLCPISMIIIMRPPFAINHWLKFYPLTTATYHQDVLTSFYEVWIEVVHLPLTLWTEQIFQFIGDSCGVILRLPTLPTVWYVFWTSWTPISTLLICF